MTIYEKILNKNVTNQIATYKNNVNVQLLREQDFLEEFISLLERNSDSQLLNKYINTYYSNNQHMLRKINSKLNIQLQLISSLTEEEILNMTEEEFNNVFGIIKELNLRIEGI